MTKEDKVFFTGLIKRLEGRFDGLEGRFDGLEKHMNARFDEHDKRFAGIDTRFDSIDTRFDGIDTRFDRLEKKVEENSQGIRYNGMMIELMRDDITLINERDSFHAELGRKVDEMYEVIKYDIPAIKKAISSHSLRISALEAKCG